MANAKRITNLRNLVRKLPKDQKELFDRIYAIEVSDGTMKVPTGMQPWVCQKFGSVKKTERQRIVHISNRLTGEGVLFNELRASRPFDKKSEENLDLKNCEKCNFCRPQKSTPSDSFGRIKGKYCLSASNVAKYDYFHGLVIFKEHNPLILKKAWLKDYLETSEKWFEKAEKSDPKATNKFLMWNCLWRSGASIVHGHMQLTASKSEYASHRHLREVTQGYEEIFGADYFEDIFKIHDSLGLAKKSGKAKILAYLTPKKEKEVFMFSKAKSFVDLSPTLFSVVQNYKKLGVQTYNLAIFKINEYWVARLVDRGDLRNRSSDIGTMELFADPVVASDPFRLIEKI